MNSISWYLPTESSKDSCSIEDSSTLLNSESVVLIEAKLKSLIIRSNVDG